MHTFFTDNFRNDNTVGECFGLFFLRFLGFFTFFKLLFINGSCFVFGVCSILENIEKKTLVGTHSLVNQIFITCGSVLEVDNFVGTFVQMGIIKVTISNFFLGSDKLSNVTGS